MISIDRERCTGCGICEQVCPVGVFHVSDKASANDEKCINCKNCEISCPTNCITLGEAIRA